MSPGQEPTQTATTDREHAAGPARGYAARRWRFRPDGSTWGDFGPDDELGRLNLLTPERVRAAVAEVSEGLTFSLSLPLDYPGGNTMSKSRRRPPVIRPVALEDDGADGYTPGHVHYLQRAETFMPGCVDVFCDDLVLMHLHYSTQWDSLAHVGQLFDADGDGTAEIRFYNGFRGGDDVMCSSDPMDAGPPTKLSAGTTAQAKRLGVDKMAAKCVQGRGVMVDLHAHFGNESRFVGYDDLTMVFEKDDVVVEPGDFVCFHTGMGRALLDMEKKPDRDYLWHAYAALDGRDERLLQWVTDSGVVALIADNPRVEARYPQRPESSAPFTAVPLHSHCLFKLGVYLGEYWYLTELASWLRANNRSRFLLTAQPLRLPGAVGSPPAPVATV